MHHDQRFIVWLSSRTSKRFGRNSDYTRRDKRFSRATCHPLRLIIFVEIRMTGGNVACFSWKARRNSLASFAMRWKSDSKIGRTFFLKPICKKHALVEKTSGGSSKFQLVYTVAPFPKCVLHIKVIPRVHVLICVRCVHVEVDMYRRHETRVGVGRVVALTWLKRVSFHQRNADGRTWK